MEKYVLLGGKQGQGINKASEVLAKIFSDKGYFTFKYRDYSSLIEGGHSFNVLAFSDKKIDSHSKKVDILVAHDKKTLTKHGERVAETGEIFKVYEEFDSINLNISYNMVSVGLLSKYFGIKIEAVKKVLKEEFPERFFDQNFRAVKKGYESTENVCSIKDMDRDIKIMSGSEGIARGAIDSGLDVYLAYPMTPATPVLHLLAEKESGNSHVTYQLENELSVANAALGSAHTGAKTMVGTSGGGYDLMQEATSMQGISEIPLTVYLSQRAGAGSGVPTYTEQGDLEVALKGGHGTFPRVVIAPGDSKECLKAVNESMYFSENFRLLSVLLGDKHVAESDFSFESDVELVDVGRNIDMDEKEGDYENYAITDDGNSPRSVPGINVVKSTSYEHDEKGITVEDPKKIEKMVEKRKRKGLTVKEASKKFERFKIHGEEDSDTLIVGWGSTKGAIKDVVEDMGLKFLQLIYLEPFPKEVSEIIEKSSKIILVENNSEGLLANVLREKILFEVDEENMILKYDGRPFRKDELKEEIEVLVYDD